jgi:uncharacterized membrane protein
VRFEKSIEIDATQQRVWDVLSDLEAWPRHVDTVESVELLTPAPLSDGSRVRLKQPKLPEGTWDITAWDAPSYFEWTQKTGGITSVAGHRVAALGEDRARLTLTLDMRGLLIPIITLFYRRLTNDYMTREAEGMKRAAESAQGARTEPSSGR